MTLDGAGLQMERDLKTKTVYIKGTPSGKIVHLISSPIILKVKNSAGFSRYSETVEVNDQDIESDIPADMRNFFKNNLL